jgi:hypothetical protein
MQYSRAKCIIVYSSLRHIFSKPGNAALRKSKAIKAVVQRHRLTVSYYSEKELISFLRHLLKQGIFESKDTARSVYPELFLSSTVQKETEQVPKPSSVPDPNLSIMEEQKLWRRE